jgi:hypothetical protein
MGEREFPSVPRTGELRKYIQNRYYGLAYNIANAVGKAAPNAFILMS